MPKEKKEWTDAKREIKKELGVFIAYVKGEKISEAMESWDSVKKILDTYDDGIDLDINL